MGTDEHVPAIWRKTQIKERILRPDLCGGALLDCTGHTAEGFLEVRLLFFQQGFLLFHAAFRNGHFSGKRVFSGHHKVDGFSLLSVDDCESIFLFPIFLELLLGQDVEVHGNAGLGQFVQNGPVKLSPGNEVFHLFFQDLDFHRVIFGTTLSDGSHQLFICRKIG